MTEYRQETGYLVSSDPRMRLYYEKFLRSRAKKAVLIVQGRAEFTQKYHHLLDKHALGSLPCNFYLVDLRGQGQSDGWPGHVRRYQEYVDDLHRVVQWIQRDIQEIVVLSHSTGSLISLNYLLLYPKAFLGVVLSSPLIGFREFPLPNFIRKGVAQSFVYLGFEKKRVSRENRKKNLLTHDQVFYEKFGYGPLVCPPPTFEWVVATYKAMEVLKENLYRISVPLLILAAGEDLYIPKSLTHQFYQELKQLNKDVTYHLFPNMMHELLNEKDNQKVFQMIRAFFRRFM